MWPPTTVKEVDEVWWFIFSVNLTEETLLGDIRLDVSVTVFHRGLTDVGGIIP